MSVGLTTELHLSTLKKIFLFYMELLPIERSEYGCLTNDSGEPQHYVNADIHKPWEKKLYENVDRAIKFMSWKFK